MLFAELASFQPFDEHQLAAADQIRFAWQSFGAQLYTRENPVCHFTASAWIVNPACTHALMVYHNIYQSWSWTGGHNDGNPDFQSVAHREAVEETGLSSVSLLCPGPVRWDTLCVPAHRKNGQAVAPHLHLNATYLYSADEDQPLSAREGENSAVRWVPIEALPAHCSEPLLLPIYQWLCKQAKLYTK